MAKRPSTNHTGPAAVAALRARQSSVDSVPRQLSTGVWVRLKAVPAGLIDEARSNVQDPPIPTVFNPDKEREEENPLDPTYARLLAEADEKRSQAAFDITLMEGFELVDGPEGNPVSPDPDSGWLKRIRFYEKRGYISTKGYNLDDEMELELFYKRFWAVGVPDMAGLYSTLGLKEEEFERAVKSFQRSEG